MDILADLAGSTKALTGYRCFMYHLRASNAPLAEQAQRGIDSTIPADLVAQWLRDHDVAASGQQIRNHRRGKCETCRQTSSPT